MHGRQPLLQLFVALLRAQGVYAECLDPWRGWVTFKQYVRVVSEVPDPGVSVQFANRGSSFGSLYLLRQVLEPREANRLEPVGGVVCEFAFAGKGTDHPDWELWSFDFPSFERFVDAVEQHDPFIDLVARTPHWSGAYWKEA